jgi:hypothetical protein
MGHSRESVLGQLTDAIGIRHYSMNTERTHVDWTRQFLLSNQGRPLSGLGATRSGRF